MPESKIILITGTSSGFGFLAAQQLAEQGHIVYASMRNIEGKNKDAAERLAATSKNIMPVELDVSVKENVDAVVRRVVEEQGRIDVLVNNAGVMNVGITEAYTDEQHYTQMEANYFGPARLFRAVLPHMRAATSGLVVTVTSLAGRFVFPGFSTYCATKFAAEALAEGYRYELAPFQVDSVIVEPGPFKTSLFSNSPKAACAETTKAYGEHGDRLNGLVQGFETLLESPEGQGTTDPQIVVDDIIKLIDAPYGTRPLRTVCGLDFGTRKLNETTAAFQSSILETMEMSDLDPSMPKMQETKKAAG